MIGRRLGHFRLEAQLGAGGMGVVYRARDENLERDVALKVLPPGALADDAARRRFRQEALTLARLSHPHINQVYEFGSEGGLDYLVMELVHGESLDARVARGPMPEAELLEIGLQLASALEAAHEAGVIHRDLKPANLMRTGKGGLKVLDFGLAKLLEFGSSEDSTQAMTAARAVTGTLPYMSPEQLRAEAVDARSDLWAAGVVLYELATGKRPFQGEVLPKLTDAILHSQPASCRDLNPGTSEGLARVIARCMEKDRGRRFSSATELRLALEPLVRTRGGTGRRRPWTAAAALLVFLAALAGGWAWMRRSARAAIGSLAVLPLANLSGDAGQDYFVDGMTDVLITELTRLKGLKVISRTSCMRFKNSKQSLPEIAKALGVEAVVEGSVQRAGGRVRVNAQLIRAATDEHLWAEVFDRQEEDVLALHSEIARAIAGQVKLALDPGALAGKSARKVNPEAFDLVLRAGHLLGTVGGPKELPRVIQMFEKAVAIDPDLVEAHAGLASALQAWAAWGFGDYWEVHPRIEKEVDRALALDPNDSWALAVKAELQNALGDQVGRREYNRKALDADPGSAGAICSVGWDLEFFDGDPRGEDLIRRAVELDPMGQQLRCSLMTLLYVKHRYPEAEAEARKILELDPNWFFAWDFLFRLHHRNGRLVEAQEESRKAWKIVFGDDFNPPKGLSWEAYDRWLEQFLGKQPVTFIPIWLADIYVRRGDKARALEYLEKAAKANKIAGVMPLNYPEWDPLRDEPRFKALVEKMGLPAATFCRISGK